MTDCVGLWQLQNCSGRERHRIQDFEKQEETSLLILSIGPGAIQAA